MVVDERLQDEFGTLAAWTHDAVVRLGGDHALPAACRGSGRPAGLEWLLSRLDPGAGTSLLDVGSGLGGPAAFARERAGVQPVCLEPMRRASAAAAAMFRLPTLVAEGARLPLASGSFALAWSLGTLCTTVEKAVWLAELRRVLRPSGRLGLLVVMATGESFEVAWGNAFPSEAEVNRLLGGAGFAITDEVWADELAEADAGWQRREEAVEAAVRAAHGDDDRFRAVVAQEHRMGELLDSGLVRGRLLVAAASRG